VKDECVDKEFNVQCNPRTGFCINHFRFVPIDLIDVAGLVPGAHEGKGMGNQFLDDLNEADALVQIIDISGRTDAEGNSVGSYDPEEDIKFLQNELDQWYLRIIKKGWDKFSRAVNQEHLDVKKAIAKQLSGLRVTEEMAVEAIDLLGLSKNPTQWSKENLLSLASELRKRSKPMIIAANKIDVNESKNNFERLKNKYNILPCSAEVELALREATKSKIIDYVPGESEFKIVKEVDEGKKKGLMFMKNFLKEFKTTGVQAILNEVVFNLLGYISIYPGGVNKLEDKDGNVLPDCFLMREGSTALDFAYRLHTDFGKNFIRAIDVRTKRTVGKEHELKHNDVVEIVARV